MATNTAASFTSHTGNNSAGPFSISFSYLSEDEIDVTVDGVLKTKTTHYTFPSATTISFTSGNHPANSAAIKFQRNTNISAKKVDFVDGAILTEADLDTNTEHLLFGLQEVLNHVDTKEFTSAQIQDGTIVNADVNASAAIDGTKISPNFGSQNIATSGTVDGRDVSADGSKLDGIEAGAKDDQTAAEIRTLVESASDSNVFTDADHTKLNGIDTGAKDDQTAAEIRTLVESATDSNVFTDADHTKLNGIDTGAKDDQTAAEIKTLLQSDKLTSSEIATGALDGRYYTETELLTDGALDGRYYTETEADARFYNLASGEEIQSGETWSAADNKIATTAAIDARIIDLVDDVGGFVPIANETSFPAANPDVNNGAGTLVSVQAFASSHTPSGGSVTIANGAGSGNTVTITGCGSTVLAAGFGGIVETTSTLHTYTFHRLSPKATEVTTVAGNITNINTVAGISSNVTTVAGISSNVTTVAGVSANVTTVAGVAANVTTVAGIASDVTAVANDATDIGAVAAKATEIGRLGTADAVADLNTLGTTAIVSDLDTCATNITNINTVGGSISNVNTVASNISTVNDFADRYRVASSAPGSNNDEGDLYFDTTSNELRVYNGSAWQGGVTATGNLAGLGSNTFTGAQTFIAGQTFDGRDVSADGTKLDGIATSANNYSIATDLLDEDNFATNSATKVASQQSIKAYVDANAANTTYAISCVDGDNTDEEKIRLTAGGSGSGTDDIVLEAGTGLSIARSSDKITFTNTVSNTDTQLTEEQVEDFVGGMLTGNTETGITVTYQDADGTIDFVVDSQTDNNFTTTLKNKLDGIAASATNVTNNNQLTNGAGYITATLTEEQVEDFVGGMVTGNTETGITVTYQDSDGTLDFAVASQTDNNFTTTLKNKLDGIASSANNYSISTDLLDEDDLATDSATKVPSQQSVKAFASNASNLASGTVAAARVATLNQDTTGSSGSCTGNAATATVANNLTGSPNITVGTIGSGDITTPKLLVNGANGTAYTFKVEPQTAATPYGLRIKEPASAGSGYPLFTVTDNSGNAYLRVDSVTGKVSDSKGDLRSIPQNTQGSAYELLAADAGKHILASGNITWVDSRHAAGDAITIVNNTAGNITITKGTTMYNTADGSNANRTLATRGMATILWASATVAYISGAGLT